MVEDERNRLIAQWKAEARAEALASRRQQDEGHWHRRAGRCLDSEFGELLGKVYSVLYFLETFICNLPLTVGAIAMGVVTLGVVWYVQCRINCGTYQLVCLVCGLGSSLWRIVCNVGLSSWKKPLIRVSLCNFTARNAHFPSSRVASTVTPQLLCIGLPSIFISPVLLLQGCLL